MSIGKREIAILKGLAADVAEFAKDNPEKIWDDFRRRERATLAREGMAALDPAKWLGIEITASQSVMNGRSYRRLEAAGLIERIHSEWSNKTTHLKITKAGKAEVKGLSQEK